MQSRSAQIAPHLPWPQRRGRCERYWQRQSRRRPCAGFEPRGNGMSDRAEDRSDDRRQCERDHAGGHRPGGRQCARRTFRGEAMKFAVTLVAVGWANVAHAAVPPGQDLGALGPAMLGVVAAGASTMATMPADHDGNRIWATWTDESLNGRAVRLALLERHGRVVDPVWSVSRNAAYSPTLSSPSGWTYDHRPVILLRYQLGAAFTHSDLFGIDSRGQPISLGEIEGALIEIVESGGDDKLLVHDTADLKGPPTCYAWQAIAHKLAISPCTL